MRACVHICKVIRDPISGRISSQTEPILRLVHSLGPVNKCLFPVFLCLLSGHMAIVCFLSRQSAIVYSVECLHCATQSVVVIYVSTLQFPSSKILYSKKSKHLMYNCNF